MRELEEEDTVGHTLAITSTLTENVCTWWIGSLRERLLVCHIVVTVSHLIQLTNISRRSATPSVTHSPPSSLPRDVYLDRR